MSASLFPIFAQLTLPAVWLSRGYKVPVTTVQEDLRTEYYLWQVHNVVQDIDKAEAEVAKDEAKLAGLEKTLSKSEGEVGRGTT